MPDYPSPAKNRGDDSDDSYGVTYGKRTNVPDHLNPKIMPIELDEEEEKSSGDSSRRSNGRTRRMKFRIDYEIESHQN